MTAPSASPERERLRAAVTQMVHVFVSREASDQDLTTWAEIVERFTSEVAASPPESVFWGLGGRGIFAVKGVLAPPTVSAPPAEVGDELSGTVTFRAEQEGHPGIAHGGSIAQVFDYVFGAFEVARDGGPFTRELNVRFIKPVPIGSEVVFEARIERVEGTRIRASGRAAIDGVAYAEADAELVMRRPPPQ
jgi:acyl-coenzyme A thioesterase PaaI-like protein